MPHVAHFHGGPLAGKTQAIPDHCTCWPITKPTELNYSMAEQANPLAPARAPALVLVTGRYQPAPWNNDPHRWDWQGWDDAHNEPRDLPPLINDYDTPDAMRLDAATQAAQHELAAWDAILHPQRQCDESG